MLFRIAIRLAMSGLAAAGLFVGAVNAQNSPRVIKAGDINTYPPFAFKDIQSGEFTGLDRDLFEAMAKKIGATVKWEIFSWQDMTSFAPLKTGRVDIYGGGGMQGHAARRAQGVSFIDFVKDPYAFYALKSNAEQLKTPAALCGKRVMTFRGNVGTTRSLDKWNDEVCVKTGRPALVKVDMDGGTPTAKLELKQGRVDLAMGGAGSIAYSNMSEGGIYIMLPKPVGGAVYGMAFMNENKELGESLKKGLDELIEDGTYVQLLKKWNLPVEDSSIGRATINGAPEPDQ
ncbi:transporter substrate-binding domain-containing protein [Bradyrhizobium hipponense]|uniref:Transporter substrate-binding domain-containing protein n=1 Tax=Bradyrhizobium hipponense TaxID=2605638 RepID=A0A5S4Y9P8_9BRAD|nr:transporter substrate-binding domain-containing protein [Bradyrhizobium hipponense]TYO61150.1 transporter substrate-binding domain-containing protein [Bradyrhizobium hipponense]